VLVTIFVFNSIRDMWHSNIQEDTSYIFTFYNSYFELASLEVEKQSLMRFSLLKFLHYIATVILSMLHFNLILQLIHFKFNLLDFSVQVIIFLNNLIIISFHTHLLRLYYCLKFWRCLIKEYQIAL
jgi:hypothetical protein